MANNTNDSKKYISLTRLSTFLDNLTNKFAALSHKHTTADLTDYKVDTALSPTSNNPVANSALDAEFEAMANAMGALELAIDNKADASHNHDDKYDTKGAASTALDSAKAYADQNKVPTSRTINGKALSTNITLSASDVGALPSTASIPDSLSDLTSDSTHRTVTDTEKATWNAKSNFSGNYNDLTNKPTIPSISGLATETYADTAATTAANKVKNDLLNGAGTAYDTLKELGDLIDDNQDAIEALEAVAAGKADKTHSHAIADVSGLQSALDGKAAFSHGTHVSYSTTAPVMDGTASVGTATTVARSDHKHPTDTSRASKTEFDTHNADTTKHITSTERTNWNAAATNAATAQTRADSAYTLAESKVDNLSDLGITATATELNYMDGVTSNVQTQLDGKASSSHVHSAGDITSGTLSINRLPTIPIEKGGTGATNVAEARTSLGLGDSIALKSVETTLPYGNNWSDVVYGDEKFVAVAENSSVAVYSTNGATWAETTMPTSAQWKSVVYGNGKFVAIAYDTNVAAYSTDGITWMSTTMPTSTNWQTAAFGNGTFIAVALSSSIAAYSTDGITWEETNMPSSKSWYCACFGNGTFVAVANGTNVVAYSTDGINWAETTMPSSANWLDVAFGNGKFITIASNNTTMAYSTDGVVWKDGYMPVSTTWTRVAYGDGVFVAIVNNSTRTAYSTDGITWEKAEMTLIRNWRCFTYGCGKFVAIPYGDTDATISADGITWSTYAQVLKDVNDTDITQTVKNALGISGASANDAVLITIEDIDAICGSTV